MNGLVTATLLAKAGAEGRSCSSGRTASAAARAQTELAPGFRCQTLRTPRPSIRRSCRSLALEQHGLSHHPPGRGRVLADARRPRAGPVARRHAREPNRFARSRRKTPKPTRAFFSSFAAISGVLRTIDCSPPPSIDDPTAGDLFELLEDRARVPPPRQDRCVSSAAVDADGGRRPRRRMVRERAAARDDRRRRRPRLVSRPVVGRQRRGSAAARGARPGIRWRAAGSPRGGLGALAARLARGGAPGRRRDPHRGRGRSRRRQRRRRDRRDAGRTASRIDGAGRCLGRRSEADAARTRRPDAARAGVRASCAEHPRAWDARQGELRGVVAAAVRGRRGARRRPSKPRRSPDASASRANIDGDRARVRRGEVRRFRRRALDRDDVPSISRSGARARRRSTSCRHTCSTAPYHLRGTTWDAERDRLGRRGDAHDRALRARLRGVGDRASR